MLFKLIDHQRKPCMTSETFDHGIWAAILISETSSVVSGVTASCNIKQVSFFFLSIFFFSGQDNWTNLIYFVLKWMFYYSFAFKLPVKQH